MFRLGLLLLMGWRLIVSIDKEKVYILKQNLKTLCCSGELPVGQRLKISYQYSKNRVYVYDLDTGFGHKVKFSSLRRCSHDDSA